MIGKARRERRRQARAAIERYEYQHANDQLQVEAAELRAVRAEAAEREQAANLRGMAQRLDDANAELARWGLEPISYGAESDEHPARYRRSSDWRTFRSGEELVELLERSNIDPDGPVQPAAIRASAPAGVDIEVEADCLPCRPTPAAGEGGFAVWRCADCGAKDWHRCCPVRNRAHYESDAPAVAPLEMIEPGQPIALDHPARDVLREARLETVELRDQIEWLRNARESDLATLASELGWPGEDPITASGLCLRVRDVLAAALDQRRELERQLRDAEVLADTGATTRAREAEAEVERLRAELGNAQHRIGDLQGDVNVHHAATTKLRDELEGVRESLELAKAQTAELRAGDPGEGWVDRELFEAQRTEAERLQRQNDVLTGEVTRLKLLQENLTPLPPVKGDVITVRLRDGRTQRCTVLSVMPVGDLGFSLSLEPESPPL